MHAFLIIIFMMIIGALIGGVTNVIAVKMLFHPFKTYYIFNKRVPFTPGLIPKRRAEIADKIGQVIEEHLLTESMIQSKLNATATRTAIEEVVQKQIEKLKEDRTSFDYLAKKVDIDIAQLANEKIERVMSEKLELFYYDHSNTPIAQLIPEDIEKSLDSKVEAVPELLFDRARVYLKSEKGASDIASMLDTFFNEKGKIVGLLQMFMTKESIADRIQHELIRLTNHPKAKVIANQIIENEYTTFKSKQLSEVLNEQQFQSFKTSVTDLAIGYMDINNMATKPLNNLMPNFIGFLENKVSQKLTNVIIENTSKHISPIMKKVNLRQMVEQQINTFDLAYIEKLIIDIANKELKLIMLLGFLLGGIIGLLQGVIAIFV
ncbi:DUF445 family protein [Staphylococcus pseudoxylosus]|uniref:DUF445 domain-containing protein n=1 Tax=Staphylococcus pseudoxylosus TaxID=2282419 RepID=UPI002990606D|nr:DUF445 family protein [Staphylococcus pseudoxylosus]MDW8798412.1 DUF445 family protein [Staphylococcus pseudoxylosus]MEB6036180.1 DUF445 family protein [Staphylococcus pseudoxylosus]MEB6045473.1 DUF445 family protein [Staphylococcus pseudoxylosus]MEB7752198.1 DUF445 family protein [Staphylococcus pseudoxylosus]MEB7762748.1 DUF445 family protein [Staphylococcus pseudoxylosus]